MFFVGQQDLISFNAHFIDMSIPKFNMPATLPLFGLLFAVAMVIGSLRKDDNDHGYEKATKEWA